MPSSFSRIQTVTPIDRKTRRPEQLAHIFRTMGKIYQVVVMGFRGEKMVIDVSNTEEQMNSMTVLQLKNKISERLPGNSGREIFIPQWNH